MAEREIALLKDMIARLDDKKFDLEAWKNYTIIFLERIFGKESTKIKMIKNLHYDYSSWSLRDTAAAGKTKDKDPVRMQADEILSAAIIELETLGLPENTDEKEIIWGLLQDELTGKQVKEIEQLIHTQDQNKTEKVSEILDNLNKENLVAIIAKLLTS